MAFTNYAFFSRKRSIKMTIVLVAGFLIVLTGVGFIMFYLGRQSVFDNYTVLPYAPQ